MQNQYQGKTITIIGLGTTGLSCVEFFADKQAQVRVIDTRANPAGVDKLSKDIPLHTGSLNLEWLLSSDLIVISPGLALATPEIQQAIQAGVEVVGDIELLCREAKAPIIAITGANGKSTVTTLTTEMAKQAGIKVGMGGNIGVPALSLLKSNYELYVLELSSFQLETTYSLKAKAATILNISEDHMDRYNNSVEEYRAAKLRIYQNAENIIVNGEDPLTYPTQAVRSLKKFAEKDAEYTACNGELYSGDEAVIAINELKITGRHNVMNALASMALAEAAGVARSGIVKALQSYSGLDHRFQLVPTNDGVRWINDSKATNVGSTVAALNGLQVEGTLYLLLGGDGKDADFSELKPFINQPNTVCYCFGKDGAELAALTQNSVLVETMTQAVAQVRLLLKSGDMVLLSPACASLDQFKNFEERGRQFVALAQGVI
ncbi:UDP-N-acetylmuramoyl-L-alanine--D-glutamate ligase [Glaesserella parasuis]|uniref:UDP-N-acetylmuramoylalanine--D-glutamate ligase n=1 Tax=Glaesserella parasuis HPS10 TaxID=1450514 RepID=A0A836Z283_GLAPU|nr:UDP-N-acetylmuramoyl-L-alanine--D-glutamate ligase [Glaesserella parasuis]KDB48738.1 UDP-N-acetylmuramoyl-L-alanyl-D-glutamate synthetase [Glaesserella parasuis HPS10]MCT8539570.1 UDP-N-acetylmuramoyl-L-alanine--D-glutamate ligase [Glaesserella parasuis]MCT8562760.1 UDP-N-acetylmuramoyl-L-alanine--D-glutamate ligase [Glaesserella parasuis]MCT8632030.1 UDP-N-acetylmuramoyl-L-alanine--D-glutamate ligase [Glaesserella parasuis]MCT8749977.1 UDP-N-acetylmuramoyl-L-alanine--D-glutamate ligase [Gl